MLTDQGQTTQGQNPGAEPQILDASAITAGLAGGAPAADPGAPETPPEAIGGVPRDQFLSALQEVSGGVVKDVDTFRTTLQAAGRAAELETRVREFEARSQVSPFHSDLSKKVDDMLRSGNSPADVLRFVELSSLDLDTMDTVDAMRRHYTMSKPGFTADEIDELVKRDLGFDPTEKDLTPLQTAAMKERRQQAIEYLKGQQVATSNPQAVERARADQERAATFTQTWNQVVPTLDSNLKWEFALEGGLKAELPYQPSTGAVEQARQAVLETIKSDPLAFPPTHATAKDVQELYQNFIILADFERIREALYNDGVATGAELASQRYSGNGATLQRPGGTQQSVPAANGGSGQPLPAGSYIR